MDNNNNNNDNNNNQNKSQQSIRDNKLTEFKYIEPSSSSAASTSAVAVAAANVSTSPPFDNQNKKSLLKKLWPLSKTSSANDLNCK